MSDPRRRSAPNDIPARTSICRELKDHHERLVTFQQELEEEIISSPHPEPISEDQHKPKFDNSKIIWEKSTIPTNAIPMHE